MNILSDYHHSGLYHSLSLLLEKRLGHNLYRQIGLEWYEKGFWNVYHHLDTAKQYLELGNQPKDGTPPLNNESDRGIGFSSEEIIFLKDIHHNSFMKAITFDTFEKMQIDIVIASIPQHIKPFKELARMKNAKFIFQMGNMFTEVMNNLHEIPNLLSSTIPFPVPPTCNAVFYHQEIDGVFKPSPVTPQRLITSFINVYHANGGFEDFMTLKAIVPGYEFKSYGGQCQDGGITGVDKMAEIMQKSAYGFHVKRMGDGFGHVLYNWFAIGKPVITRISDYKGKLGEELLENNVTCIDLDVCNYQEACDKIINMPGHLYQWMCQRARDRFDECVDYDAEEEKIKEFLEKLL